MLQTEWQWWEEKGHRSLGVEVNMHLGVVAFHIFVLLERFVISFERGKCSPHHIPVSLSPEEENKNHSYESKMGLLLKSRYSTL